MSLFTLAIDVGNSNIKWGFFIGRQLKLQFSGTTCARTTADEHFAGYTFWAQRHAFGLPQRIVISSVVPQVSAHLEQMCRLHFRQTPLLVSASLDCGLTITTERANELGSDLISNAVAAYDRLRQNCIVIAFGTALTFVGVDRQAAVSGVAISVGVDTMLQALVGKAALLAQIPLEKEPRAVLGRNTEESLSSGLINGTLGTIKQIVTGAKDEIGADSLVIATGYRGGFFTRLSPCIDIFDSQLTMKGLYLIAERNCKESSPNCS